MKIKISNIKVPVGDNRNLESLVSKRFGIDSSDMADFKILHAAVDARKKSAIFYNYQILIELKKENRAILKKENVTLYEPPVPVEYHEWHFATRPVIVGFGPAGMFAALYLARCNARPIVIERGSAIEKRKQEVSNFLKSKELDENSNIQFGEGGAGAFSDGKLSTNNHSEFISFVLEEFHRHGASEEILYAANPHVGTDYLEKVVRSIREEIKSLGGEILFNTTFTDFKRKGNLLKVICNNNIEIETEHLLLGLGHSARDTIRLLYEKGVPIEAKPFSMGVRIEHLQAAVNKAQYGSFAKHLPPAEYKGAVHLKERSVYTFCMCPGGEVMASTSEVRSIVTNGMSTKARDKANANAALLVNVNPEDYYDKSPLDGLYYQEKYEKAAFAVAGDYRAPANLVREFSRGEVAKSARSVAPSYPHGVIFNDFNSCLPPFVVSSLREALPHFARRLSFFSDGDAVLTGVETRSSSPVRILRGETRESAVAGIYPIGEGAGYAGGITTAAIDGLKTAIKISSL